MNKAKIILVFSFVFLCLLACSMPETKIYSIHFPLTAEKAPKRTVSSVAVSVTAVRHLTQPYIAYRTSPFQLGISKYSKWDMPPDEMAKEAIRDTLVSSGLFKEIIASGFVPGGFHSLKVHLKRFERSDEGGVLFGELAFDITLLSPDGTELYRGMIAKKERLNDAGFLSLAQGLSGALQESMREVQAEIGKAIVPARE